MAAGSGVLSGGAGVDGYAAGNFSSGCATHAIADNEQTFVGTYAEGIFIGGTNLALVRGSGSLVTVLTELRHAGSVLYTRKLG